MSEREEVLKGLRRVYDLAWAMSQTITNSALRRNLTLMLTHLQRAIDYLSLIGGIKSATVKPESIAPEVYSTTDVSELLEVLKEDTKRRTAGRELAEMLLDPGDNCREVAWWKKAQFLARTALGEQK